MCIRDSLEEEAYKNYCSEVSKFNTITDPNLLLIPEEIMHDQSSQRIGRRDEEIEEEIEEDHDYRGISGNLDHQQYMSSERLKEQDLNMYAELMKNSPQIVGKSFDKYSVEGISMIDEQKKDFFSNTRPFTPPFSSVVQLESNQALVGGGNKGNRDGLQTIGSSSSIRGGQQQLVEVIYDAVLNLSLIHI
eukprot:TRINITY_DN6786_c0_g2_i1.p1 TRINITY_DN6786_c0_g2~~TRINITY_DN6786_c0_g2_i1.p1  ORF type:complete len:201 (-),score=19.43 TRINITY_DN6786_c0_g2_i1:30-599(-)